MRETTFHAELGATFRAAGYWVMKWPDVAVSRMEAAGDGKLRFTTPKPFDLIGCQPGTARFLAIEAKLLRAATFRVDARMLRQVATLQALEQRGALAMLALNFRFTAARRGTVNRAFLVTALKGWQVERLNAPITLDDLDVSRDPPFLGWWGTVRELCRVSGGWAFDR